MEPITALESRILDANSEYFGVPSLHLMENAGMEVAKAVLEYRPKSVAVLCGTGNNGGDGMVAARHLWDAGVDAHVVLLGLPEDIRTEEARHNWKRLGSSGVEACCVPRNEGMDAQLLSGSDVVVDAVLGTGASGELRPIVAKAVRLANQTKVKIVSVDTPTGLDPDTGDGGLHARADLVITFEGSRPGLAAFRQKAVRIGVPPEARECVGPGDFLRLHARDPEGRKGDNGRVLVIGGGPCSGAPGLAALGALRSGADWVTVAVPRRWAGVVAGFAPDLMVRPFDGELLAPADVAELTRLAGDHDVTVVGMGLGRAPETMDALRQLLPGLGITVLDADALQPDLPLRGVLTPHRGELARLVGAPVPGGESAVLTLARFCAEREVVALLKGPADIICNGVRVRRNLTGHPGMTVGGTGDVLAGVVGALACRTDSFTAACLGAFVNGLAGQLAAEEHGNGLVASDVATNVAAAMARFDR